MVQAQPPSVGLQRESADARTLDWVSLPQLTRVICFAICRSLTLLPFVCRSLTAGVACAASCSWMCALPGPVALPPRQRPGCTGHAHTRGDPPLPTHLEVPVVPLEILQPIECAASRLVARPRRLACVVSWPLAEDWRWGLT